MKTPLSPSDIEVLMHCHFLPGPHPRLNAPAVQMALDMFVGCGMIVKAPESVPMAGANPKPEATGYGTTPKGRVYVEALCRVPEPTQMWVVEAVL